MDKYNKLCFIWLRIVGFTLISVFLLIILLDPIGILRMPIINGFNHFKKAQDRYVYVWKPYELANIQPEVLFIGTSRIQIGIYPSWPGYDEVKVYNLGLSGMPLPLVKKHLDFIYQIYKPKLIIMGLDFLQFDEGNFNCIKPGFEETRLNNIRDNNSFIKYLYAVKDTFLLKDILWSTIYNSVINKQCKRYYLRGWDSVHGRQEMNEKSNRDILRIYQDTYKNFIFSSKAFTCLEQIYQEAKDRDVQLYVFFNPISSELHNLLNSYGHELTLIKIKEQVKNIFGNVYDFNKITEETGNKEMFYDGSHYNKKFGDKIKKIISADILK